MTEQMSQGRSRYTDARKAQAVIEKIRASARKDTRSGYDDMETALAGRDRLNLKMKNLFDTMPSPLGRIPFYIEGGLCLSAPGFETLEDQIDATISTKLEGSSEEFELASGVDDAFIGGAAISVDETDDGYELVSHIHFTSEHLDTTVPILFGKFAVGAIIVQRRLIVDLASDDVIVAQWLKRSEEFRELRRRMKRSGIDASLFARNVRLLDRAIHAEESEIIDLSKPSILQKISIGAKENLQSMPGTENEVASALSMTIGVGRHLGISLDTRDKEGVTSEEEVWGRFLDVIVTQDRGLTLMLEVKLPDGSTELTKAPLELVKGLKY